MTSHSVSVFPRLTLSVFASQIHLSQGERQTQRRRRLFQKLLFGALLRFPQETGGLFAGAEQFQIHCFIVRRGAHPLF